MLILIFIIFIMVSWQKYLLKPLGNGRCIKLNNLDLWISARVYDANVYLKDAFSRTL